MSRRIKLAIIGSAGVPSNYGGFETLAEQIVRYFHNKTSNYELTVFCSIFSSPIKYNQWKSSKLKYLYLKPNGVQSIFYDIFSLIYLIFLRVDIVLVLGVSGSVFFPFFKLFSKTKIITNIDGIEWQREKWNHFIKSFLKVSEKIAIKYSDKIIADNFELQKYVLKNYNILPELIAYGADHTIENKLNRIPRKNIFKKPYALVICRLEPENNLEMIIDAFIRFNKLNLIIIGRTDTNYGNFILQRYKNYKKINFIGGVYNLQKLYDYRKNATIYIHGHSVGGTNPSLVEALSFNNVIYAHDNPYNRNTTFNKIIYFKNSHDLLRKLRKRYFIDKKINITQHYKKIINQNYLWRIIGRKYQSLFEDILN